LIITFFTRLGKLEHRHSQLCYAVIRTKKEQGENNNITQFRLAVF